MAVMFRMRLAGFGGMVMGVMAVAGRGMGVMRRGLAIVVLISLGGFAVMMRCLFMMFGGVVMMLAGGMLVRHGELPEMLPAPRVTWDICQPRRGFATSTCRPMPFAQISSADLAGAAMARRGQRHQSVAPSAVDSLFLGQAVMHC
jgi:hypothetical protein